MNSGPCPQSLPGPHRRSCMSAVSGMILMKRPGRTGPRALMPDYALKTEVMQVHNCDRRCSKMNTAGVTADSEGRRRVCTLDAAGAQEWGGDRTRNFCCMRCSGAHAPLFRSSLFPL